MQRQVCPIVAASLEREDLQVVRTNVAVVQLVFTTHVLLQQIKGHEGATVLAMRTGILQEFVEGILYLQVGEADAVPLVVQAGPDVGVQLAVRLLVLGVDYLRGREGS